MSFSDKQKGSASHLLIYEFYSIINLEKSGIARFSFREIAWETTCVRCVGYDKVGFCHFTEVYSQAHTRRIQLRGTSFCTVVGSDDGGGPAYEKMSWAPALSPCGVGAPSFIA